MEKNKICDRDAFRKMGEQGFFGVSFPAKYEGGGMDLWSAVVIAEELSHANVRGLSMSFFAHTYLPLPLINALGTEEQNVISGCRNHRNNA